jgi:uncharacterized protein
MSDAPAAMENLAESECWRLLRTAQLGRLAVRTEVGVDIFPINYVVDRGTVVFRTAPGTKLSAALTGERLAFEADGTGHSASQVWSVVVHGTPSEIKELDEVLNALVLPLAPAHGAAKPRFVRILAESVTGRRFDVVDPSHWSTPISDSRRAPRE